MRSLLVLSVALLWSSACGSDDGAGDTAIWEIEDASPPTSESTAFTASVTRLGCASGETGEVQEPDVAIEAERVVVTFTVEALSGGDYDCPGNDWVPFQVDIGEPLGDREIVDGACLGGEAATTSFCSDGPVRLSPP